VTGYDGADEDESEHEEEAFGRPFLGRTMQAETFATSAPDVHEHEEQPGGHHYSYLLTGGRTGGGASGIHIETVLVRDDSAAQQHGRLSGELARIVAACETPVAVAEVAARIGLPLGVVQVLAGDLVGTGVLLRSSSTPSLADDVLFIERLINGVAAL
jgi:hypothetical protein